MKIEKNKKTISPEALNFLRSNRPGRLPLLPITNGIAQRIRKNKQLKSTPVIEQLRRSLLWEDSKYDIEGVSVTVVKPNHITPDLCKTAALYVHGGAFLAGTPLDPTSILMADAMGVTVYSIDYSLSPENSYPVALEETLRVYQAIIQQYAPYKTVVFGVSAGCNLILSALLKADLGGLPMPAAVGLFTPWVDLTGTGDSYQSNDGRDAVVAWKNQLNKAARAYAGKAELRDPLISPIYSDYPKRFPPVMITTGTRDLLLSDCTRLYWILRNANIPVSLRVWEGMWHAVNVEPEIPEGQLIREEMAKFLVESLKSYATP